MKQKIIRKIAHVCIFAKDIDETAAWYARVLGFDKVFNFTRDGRVFGYYLDAGGDTHVEVFENAEAEYSKRNQINHICFETDDLDGFIAHAKSKGVAITEKKLGVDHTWQAWLADPSGVKLEIFQYTPDSMQFGPDGVVCQVDW